MFVQMSGVIMTSQCVSVLLVVICVLADLYHEQSDFSCYLTNQILHADKRYNLLENLDIGNIIYHFSDDCFWLDAEQNTTSFIVLL